MLFTEPLAGDIDSITSRNKFQAILVVLDKFLSPLALFDTRISAWEL